MSALARRDRFELRIELDAESLWERLVAHPRVRVSDELAPEPAPPQGAPFLAHRVGEREVRLRQWAGPADAASPVVVVQLQAEATAKGCRVVGRFEDTASDRAPARTALQQVWRYVAPAGLLAVALAIGAVVLGTSTALFLPLLAVLVAVPAGLVMIPLLMVWNAQGRREHMESLWGLVGEVFVPVALPEATDEDPFRNR